MATKKDFTKALDPLSSSIENATAIPEQPVKVRRSRSTPLTAEELHDARAAGRTQGVKGAQALRINMAFEPEMYDFIKRMAKFRGESLTVFCHHVFSLYMDAHIADYEQILDFMDRT